eukprot:6006243-Amphidinium_carterae.1
MSLLKTVYAGAYQLPATGINASRGSIGTLFMVFYISVTSIVLAPLQCESHPNGKWTIRSFQSILCWDSEEQFGEKQKDTHTHTPLQ